MSACVFSDFYLILDRAEDASGPTTTCEITTFDPEPQLELHYDNDQTYVFLLSWCGDLSL